MIMTHADKIRELERSRDWWKSHAEALDQNWSNLKDKYLNAIREALGVPADTSVPDMVAAIEVLREAAGR